MDREHQLSDEQRAIVAFGKDAGHMLVLARPGSGKTHTLAARASRLLSDGIDPRQLLAVTFSNRAAEQLQDRLPPGEIWAGTFHAICADMLEQHGSAIGVRWPFRIIDDHRARELIQRALGMHGFPLPIEEGARNRFLREVQYRIERRKREGQERDETRPSDHLHADVVAAIDEAYSALLSEANALDFADLIVKGIELLEQDEPTAELLRNRLTHILIDELHDISPEQYRLVELLAPPRSSNQVFVVGDPDQSIYEWRGALAARTIAQFRRDYRPTEFILTVNYRSRPPIIRAADALLAQPRPSQTSRDGGTWPFWCEFADAQSEARGVVESIARAQASSHFSGLGSFAVLFRTHAAGDLVESVLLQAGMPLYRVQPNRFFHQRDAPESLRYLELAFGMHEAEFDPALNWPRVVVDEVSMAHLRVVAAQHGVRPTDLVHRNQDYRLALSPLLRAALEDVRDTIVSELGPVMSVPIDQALEPFLDVLRRRRSPIPAKDREALRDTLDHLGTSLLQQVGSLRRAMDDGRRLRIRSHENADCAAAEIIVRHGFDSYLGCTIEPYSSEGEADASAFLLTLGEEIPSGGDGFGLGPLPTRTVDFTVATRAWRLMQMLLMSYETHDKGTFLVLDVETTSRHPERAEIIEYGALKFAEGVAQGDGVFSLVRPSSPAAIDPEATDIHGLRWRDVAEAVEPRHALPPLIELAERHIVVGHNIDDFDLPVLRQAARRAGLPFRQPVTIDTRRMAERVWPDEASYRLEDLLRKSAPGAVQQHRARADCLLTARLFSALLEQVRRDREAAILSECLPLVASSIRGAGHKLNNDNLLLVELGERAISLGHGHRYWENWLESNGVDVAAILRSGHSAPSSTICEEDERWQRFHDGWVSAVDMFCAGAENRDIGAFLRYAALSQPIDALPRPAGSNGAPDPRSLTADERIALMTVHSSKGLEWPVVIIVGVEDDLFPLYRAGSAEQLAEEQRTLYVGMTRARDRLLLFSSRQRANRSKQRSRFLEPLLGSIIQPVSAVKSDGQR